MAASCFARRIPPRSFLLSYHFIYHSSIKILKNDRWIWCDWMYSLPGRHSYRLGPASRLPSNPSRSWIKRKLHAIKHGVLLFMDLEGFEPLTSRMRTERSPNSLAFVHTLHTVRKGKSTNIRLYKIFCHPNDLSLSQVCFPSRWFSRWCSLGRNMVGGQVSYRPLRCNSHGVQMYRILIYNEIRCNVKAQLLLGKNESCAFYIWHQVIDWQ